MHDFSAIPAASRAIRLARRGVPFLVDDDAVGDMVRDAVTEGLPTWFKERTGWVYLAANASWPGLYKIGCTRRSVDERMASLNGAGLATPWGAVRTWYVHDAHWIEALAHAACKQFQFKGELFHASVESLTAAIELGISSDADLLRTTLKGYLLPGELEAFLAPVAAKSTLSDSYTSKGH